MILISLIKKLKLIFDEDDDKDNEHEYVVGRHE